MPLWIRQGREARIWLRAIARRYQLPVAVLRRQLRTSRNLEAEIVPLLAQYIQHEADAALEAREKPPDGAGAIEQAIRTCYQIARARQEAAERARERDIFEELKRQQAIADNQ